VRVIRTFDVIGAGEALWNVLLPGPDASTTPTTLRLKPGGGVVNSALALARRGLRVGLATNLLDDRFGRAQRTRLASAGIDVGGVVLERRSSTLLLDGTFGQSIRGATGVVEIPERWSSQVLLLAGLTPVVAQSASLCKAARAARRASTLVVLDVCARWQVWAGHDPRTMRMVLREADVVRCTTEDLTVLDMDASAVRAALRKDAVLVVTTTANAAWATGPFGAIERAAAPREVAASICAELARTPDPQRPDVWDRALQRS
jgi:sugar/nucleoside kinase (ribokinase family)